jgi:hypothetical protein
MPSIESRLVSSDTPAVVARGERDVDSPLPFLSFLFFFERLNISSSFCDNFWRVDLPLMGLGKLAIEDASSLSLADELETASTNALDFFLSKPMKRLLDFLSRSVGSSSDWPDDFRSFGLAVDTDVAFEERYVVLAGGL